MPNDDTPEHANRPARPAPATAPSLTDAQANRQLGRGDAPHTVDVPESEQGPAVRKEQPAEETAPEGYQTVKVGARDVVRPTGHIGEAQGDAGSEDNLYDRLARKDNTDSGPGPSGVA